MDQKVNRNIARQIVNNFSSQFTFQIRKSTCDLLDTRWITSDLLSDDPEKVKKDFENNQEHVDLFEAIDQAEKSIRHLENVLNKICRND